MGVPGRRRGRRGTTTTPPTGATALRELEEEASVTLAAPGRPGPVLALDHAGGGEGPLRHAVLPRAGARRTAGPEPDGEEIVEVRWFAPARGARAAPGRRAAARVPDDQEARDAGALRLRPTRRWRRRRASRRSRSCPRVDTSGHEPRVLLPGDPELLSAPRPPAGGRGRSGSPARPRTRSCRAAGRRRRRPRPRGPRTIAAIASSTQDPDTLELADLALVRARPCSRSNRNGAVESQQPLPITSESRSPRGRRAPARTTVRGGVGKHHRDRQPLDLSICTARYTRAR